MKRIIGFIPARAGSKGVLRKNVRLLNQKPLVSYAIESAIKSQFVKDIYITTDDDEVEAIASDYKLPVIRRSDELSSDSASMVEVITHALEYINVNYSNEDIFCLLQPTCPFRTSRDIDDSIVKLEKNNVDAVIGVTKSLHEHPERYYRLCDDYLIPLMPEYAGLNRQELPNFYIRNGVIYTVRINSFLKNKAFSLAHSMPLEVPAKRAVNIDQEDDLAYAEFLIEKGLV